MQQVPKTHEPARFIYLTLYSIITPFEAFEISCIGNYFGKWSFCSFGANAPFSIIFSKVFKTFLDFFQCYLKIENDVNDLKIADGGKS